MPTLGSGDSDAHTYDNNTGRMTKYQLTVGGSTETGTVGWNTNGTRSSLAISDSIPGATDNGISCSYTHDDLGRLLEANCGGAYDEKFTWDAFGNHNSGNTPSGLVTSFSFSNNQIAGASYDANGNLLADPLLPSQPNAFDAEGHAVTLEGASVVYDALGRAVEGAGAEFVYAPDGGKIALMGGQTLLRADIPLPGGGEAVYNATGFQWYRHADGQGSAVLSSTPGGGLASSTHYTPFGFDDTGAGSGYRSFTGEKQDIDSTHTGGQYDFLMREYNPIQGRWWTPDPAGLAAVDPNNPQTWNRYSYVNGTPLEATDPLGLLAADNSDPTTSWSCRPQYFSFINDEGTISTLDLGTVCIPHTTAGGDGGDPWALGPPGPAGPAPAQPNPPQQKPPSQAPTAQQSQDNDCTAAGRTAGAVEGLDAAADALIAFNLAAVHFGGAFVVVSAGCLDPTPFEPVTCVASGYAAVILTTGGLALTFLGGLQTARAISALKQAANCGPGS